jgi:hypothetical protein
MCNAQVHTAAWSGLGMIHNCCGGNTTMPPVFTRTLATVNVDNTWDWKSWVPDALVINLGTNDGSYGTHPEYVTEYVKVIMEAAKNYGSSLHVFLACGPMSETCVPAHQPGTHPHPTTRTPQQCTGQRFVCVNTCEVEPVLFIFRLPVPSFVCAGTAAQSRA